MLSVRSFIPHTTAPNGDLYAEVSRPGNTPPESGVGGAPAESPYSPYSTLNDHLHRAPQDVYGMDSASSRTDLALALGGKQRPLPPTPPLDYEDVGPRSPRFRTPTSDYEQVDLPRDTRCFGQAPANRPLPQRPVASPDLECIYSTPELPGPLRDKTPPPLPAKPSKPGVYFELELQVQTGKTPPSPPAKPPRTFVHDQLQRPVRPRTPPPPPPQHLKPGRTQGATVSPVAGGDEKKTRFHSVNSELTAFLAKRRVD